MKKISLFFGLSAVCLAWHADAQPLSAIANPASLKQAAEHWEKVIESRDPDAIAAAFAEDAIAMYPHPLPKYGREENLKAWQAVYSNPNNEHPITVDEVVECDSGNLGYVFGRWWSRNRQDGRYSGGRYVAIWKRSGEVWQITKLSANVHDDIKADHDSK